MVGLDYAFPWDGLIQAYKFRAALHLRDLLLGPLMAALAQDAAAHTCDLLLSVPLSASGLRRRGYNQSHELAKPLARRLRLPYEPLALERIQHSHAQSLLPKSERSRNVKGAFIVRPDALPRLQGRRVAIIDDVMTTGATLFELASLLKRNGAAQVQAWVIARA
ncbi:MAG: ComF family protein [Paucibacter sp.]|nr:ComF family protein [Roseateles sp.]